MAVDMAHNLGALTAHGAVSPTLQELLAHGSKVTAVHYLGALEQAQRYADGIEEIFQRV